MTLLPPIHILKPPNISGHKIAAAIAMKYLTANAASNLSVILANDGGGDLTQVATWADDVRSDPAYHWSAPLHYIDTPDWACAYTATDCPNQMCVAGAIANYSTRVLSNDNSAADEAAKFLTHFLGDIHQPLHVAFSTDRGGNLLKGYFPHITRWHPRDSSSLLTMTSS